jgi:enoyl-CoA hydratase/carnithine racemase
VIDVRDVGAVRVLTLSAGKVNTLDVELLDELTGAVHDAERAGPGPLVLTGAGHVFCAGVDLRRVVEGGADYVDRLLPALAAAFETVFAFPGPTVAAVNGAAVAGGCVLACACDRRLIVPGAPIGATEVRVGVPFPAVALEIVRYACGDQAETVILGGLLYDGGDAVAHHLAHAVVDDDPVAAAIEVVAELSTAPAAAYASTKSQLRGPIIDRIHAAHEADDDVRRTWGSPENLNGIVAYLERLAERRR